MYGGAPSVGVVGLHLPEWAEFSSEFPGITVVQFEGLEISTSIPFENTVRRTAPLVGVRVLVGFYTLKLHLTISTLHRTYRT